LKCRLLGGFYISYYFCYGRPFVITAEKVYAMLGNAPLWETAKTCHELLAGAHTPYAIAGGVAVCLHGYQRNTVDLDLLVSAGQADVVRKAFDSAGIVWNKEEREFRTPEGIAIHFMVAGEPAGKGSEVRLPDPSDPGVVTELEGLPVLSLPALVEAKIACGQANLRRTHKDFADVVELISKHHLGRDFARHLHKSVRGTFRELVTHGQAE
jgi:Aminoglycoside-2''-adenylyltransferase